MGKQQLYFACSDIHSHFNEWMSTLADKGFDIDNSNHHVIVCGDLFDRGLQSKQCLEFAKQLAEQHRLVYVRGNHEDLVFDAVQSIEKRTHLGRHHLTNGTLQTLVDIMEISIYDLLSDTFAWTTWESKVRKNLLKFIDTQTQDFFELGDTIFVHGWLPTDATSDNDKTLTVKSDWRDGNWREARWDNGMEMFKFGLSPLNKTIVCGHWHASYGHANIAKKCAEFGPDAIFTTYHGYDDETNSSIIALDACTIHTKFVNCVVFDEQGRLIEDV